MIIWGVFFDSIIDVWQFNRVLNAPGVFYEIAILHIYWRPLVSKLQVVSLQRYCKNSQRISWKFSNFLQNSYPSKTLDNCFRFHQKLLLCLCFPCSLSFKKNVYVTFACFSAYLMKNYCIVLKLQNFDFCIMFSHEVNLTNMWDNFWKIFLFGWT